MCAKMRYSIDSSVGARRETKWTYRVVDENVVELICSTLERRYAHLQHRTNHFVLNIEQHEETQRMY
ncbi:hypothetical protein PsorP6_003685 [Peronosclerospora sorghi]|uniref:Uncharacterized protein n=1 Tax=Peronosclerospora sorghi TaxID=230839 RepID=A0ACC0VQ68_9STRA|nr:hypothetical protein PsorP6_003685 [Peronosclerospora sorghi]